MSSIEPCEGHMIKKSLFFLGALIVMLAALMASDYFGFKYEWLERTLPYRLMQDLILGWSLLFLLSLGFLLIYRMSGVVQAIVAVVFSGALIAFAVVSVMYFDSFLCLLLLSAAAPLLKSGVSSIKRATDK
jgi:hypothetical protein